MTEAITILELVTNTFALGVAGVLYFAYIQNLRSQVDQKQEKVDIVEKNLQLWKDRAADLEKKTPDFIVHALSERVKDFEEEIKRLHDDKKTHASEIQKKNTELKELREELEQAKASRKSLEEVDIDEYIYESEEVIVQDQPELAVPDPVVR